MNNPLQGPKQQEGNEDLHPLLLRSQVRLPGPGVLMGFSRPMNDCNSIPGWNKQATLCSTVLHKETIAIGNAFVKKLLRHICSIYGGFQNFGFHPNEIRNKFLRSGSTMSLLSWTTPLQSLGPLAIGLWMHSWSTTGHKFKWTNNMFVRHDPP